MSADVTLSLSASVPSSRPSAVRMWYAVAVALSAAPSRFFAAVVLEGLLDERQLLPLNTFVPRVILEQPDFRVDAVLGAAILYADATITNAEMASETKDGLGDLIESSSTPG